MLYVRRLYTILVLLGVLSIFVNSKSTSGHSHKGLKSKYRQSNTTDVAKPHRKTTKNLNNVRKSRSPQFNSAIAGLNQPRIGLDQIGLPYNPRLSSLALQGAPSLAALGQNRNLLLPNNALVANNAAYRLPYNYNRLARLLSTINLLRERSAIASAVNPELLGLYKPNTRRKYDSIPIKPNEISDDLSANPLSLLLGRSSLGTPQTTESQDDDDDSSDTDGFCSPNPCHNDGKCKNDLYGFKCICANGFTGKHCTGKNPCQPNPCQYDGECTVSGISSFDCSCPIGRKGERCEDEDRCHPNPCMNGGSCTELNDGHECTCVHGYRGNNCEIHNGGCSTNPCQNGGHCIETPAGFNCICKPGYTGVFCSASENKCLANPCQNGGRCMQRSNGAGFECDCRVGFKGTLCDEISPCQPGTCQNGGSCFASENSFKCVCPHGFGGRNCEVHRSCQLDTCKNGARCIEHENGFKCVCPSGYKGLYCEETDQCYPNPCLNGGQCVDEEGGYQCRCQGQFKGTHCEDVDVCAANPCMNGGQCLNYNGVVKCICRPGYGGERCREKSSCAPNPCHNGGQCIQEGNNYRCSCDKGYVGVRCEVIDSCLSNPCQHGGTCRNVLSGGFVCACPTDYSGKYCQDRDPCHPNPCVNGKCVATSDGFVCRCSLGFKGEKCAEEDECQPNPCHNGGRCVNRYIGGKGFDCLCTDGFKGTTCKERDACHPNPCSNHGVCSEVGGGIVCNCSQGYKGLTCEELDKCHPNPCRHGGMCEEVVGGRGYVCKCSQSYKGFNCEVKDRCHPNPCLHDGYCLEINNDVGFMCNCSFGYRGSHCQDLDPCHPNPCGHSGSCLHTSDGGFVCNCTIGFKGEHCQEKDLCKPNPCQFADKCQQTGTETYQCVKNVCDPNPCQHGGKCIEVNDEHFQCACPKNFGGRTCNILSESGADRQHVPARSDPCQSTPCQNDGVCEVRDSKFSCNCINGFTGRQCQIKPLPRPTAAKPTDLCSPSPCKNNGICVQEEEGYSCSCKSGFTGFHCQVDPCKFNPCNNNGKCIRDGKATDGFKCRCLHGFVGKRCEENYCLPNPCHNNGLCVSIANKGYQCKCREGFTGGRCERNPCSPNPCKNGGSCLVFYTVYLCKCPAEYRGTQCEVTLANKHNADQVPGVRKAVTSRPAINGSSTPKKDIGVYKYSSAPKFFPGPGEECKHCDRNAHCVGGHCICKDGFVGDGLDCWKQTEDDLAWKCEINPCSNGGTCKPGIAQCVCRLGYSGKYCEETVFPIIHLSFDRVSGGTLVDDSGNHNNAYLANGAQIVPHSGKCNNAANLLGGDIFLDGPNFQPIPRTGITIATWVKLDTPFGVQSIFDTVGSPQSENREGQYHLEINDGRIRWFHRDSNNRVIFKAFSKSEVVQEGKWIHIAATYSSFKNRARIFINGDMVAEAYGQGLLSEDWQGKVGIGKHQHEFGSRLLRGMVDEFFIFPGELPRLEILVLMRHCKVYFKNEKPKSKRPQPAQSSNGKTDNRGARPRPNDITNTFTLGPPRITPPERLPQPKRLPPPLPLPPPRPPPQTAFRDPEYESNQNEMAKLERILESFEVKNPGESNSNEEGLGISRNKPMTMAYYPERTGSRPLASAQPHDDLGGLRFMPEPMVTSVVPQQGDRRRPSQDIHALGQTRTAPRKYYTGNPALKPARYQNPPAQYNPFLSYRKASRYQPQTAYRSRPPYRPFSTYRTPPPYRGAASNQPPPHRIPFQTSKGHLGVNAPSKITFDNYQTFSQETFGNNAKPPQQKWQTPKAQTQWSAQAQTYRNPMYRPPLTNGNAVQRSRRPYLYFFPAPMNTAISYSVKQPAAPSQGKISLTSRMGSPLTYNNGMYSGSQPYSNINSPVASNNIGRPYQYQSYNRPEHIMAARKGSVNRWEAPATQAPQKYNGYSYPMFQGGARGYASYQPQASNQMYYYNYYNGQPKSQPQAPLVRTVQRTYQVPYNNAKMTVTQNDKNLYNTGTIAPIDASTLSTQLAGQNINPKNYYAFKLKSESTQDNEISYKNALRTLGTKLNELEKDRKLNLQPEQINYVMGLLGEGLTEMEQKRNSERLQPNLMDNARLMSRNTILHPLDSSSNIYSLLYPNNQQTNPYSPYLHGVLKRKKKNVKTDKTSRRRKRKSKRHARKKVFAKKKVPRNK